MLSSNTIAPRVTMSVILGSDTDQQKKQQLEINVHHLRGIAIPAGPLSDFHEILCHWWIPTSVLLSKISTLWV